MKTIRSKFTYDNLVFWFGLIFLAVSSLLTGCSNESVQVAQEQYTVQTLHYFQSDETKLCFAFQHDNGGHPVMTSVECTPEVLRMVHSTGAVASIQRIQKANHAAEVRKDEDEYLAARDQRLANQRFICEVRSFDGVTYTVSSQMDHGDEKGAIQRCNGLRILFVQPIPRTP